MTKFGKFHRAPAAEIVAQSKTGAFLKPVGMPDYESPRVQDRSAPCATSACNWNTDLSAALRVGCS